jgi:hypothetical protein
LGKIFGAATGFRRGKFTLELKKRKPLYQHQYFGRIRLAIRSWGTISGRVAIALVCWLSVAQLASGQFGFGGGVGGFGGSAVGGFANGPDVSGNPGQFASNAAPGWDAGVFASLMYGTQFIGIDATNNALDRTFGNVGWNVSASLPKGKSITQFAYSGNYNRGFGASRQNNLINQAISIGHARQVSNRTSFTAAAAAGSFVRVLGDQSIASTDIASSPITQPILDTRTYYANAAAGFTHRLNERWAASINGEGFYLSRPSARLFDPQGVGANGRLQYRLSERTTIYTGYGFNQIFYRRQIGDATFHNVFTGFGTRFNQRWQAGLQIGYGFADSTFVQSIAIDPELAEILGQSTTLAIVSRPSRFVTGQAELSYNRDRWSAAAMAMRGINPGNGAVAISRMDNAGLNFNYRGSEKISFNANSMVSQLSSVSGLPGGFRTYNAGAGVSMAISGRLSSFARYDRLWIDSRTTQFTRNSYIAQVGFGFNVANRPLRIF